ncbi:MAG: bifunctional 2-polyprenyl-6-hydroxyphenol methylase/3-demethylubiquinol 3-O-methyltransferase UbiG [Burkholderiaceae bacterium]
MQAADDRSTRPENVDPNELEKFQALAARWWDPNSEFRPLHEINPLRLAWIRERVELAGKKVLDVGCGGGILAEAMAVAGASVTGIDLANKSLQVARLHGLETGVRVEYRQISAEALAAENPGSYQVITCLEMLEHVPDPASVVQACTRLLAPGGWVFFSTINRNPKSFLFAIIGAEYLLRLLPRGTHEYARFIKPSELAGAARAAGLQADAMVGMTYNPISREYRLDNRDVAVNYLMAWRKPE